MGQRVFDKSGDIMKSTLEICLKNKMYNKCILPAMTYVYETWKIKIT